MDNLENTPAVETDLTQLRAECESLRSLTSSLLVLLLVVSGTLNLFFWRQYRATKATVTEVHQLVADYNEHTVPAINEFLNKLIDFERKYPDFSPILSKYGVHAGTFTGVPRVTAVAPSAAVPPMATPAKH